jgi:hypothetical protein
MVVVLAALLQMKASLLQPDIVDILDAWLGRDMEDSCFCVYVLLHWVWYEDEQAICEDNGEEW